MAQPLDPGKADEIELPNLPVGAVKMHPAVTGISKTDVLVLRMLIDYMAGGLVGPFQVIPTEPTTMQKVTGSKGKMYIITGIDYENRLKLEFHEKNVAKDICHALNRAYGFEDLENWTIDIEDQE